MEFTDTKSEPTSEHTVFKIAVGGANVEDAKRSLKEIMDIYKEVLDWDDTFILPNVSK